jgi:hypothetical protein
VIGFALAVAAATLGAGLVASLGLRLLPTVRLQLGGLALLAVLLPLVAVIASGWVMFHMGDDVKILAVARRRPRWRWLRRSHSAPRSPAGSSGSDRRRRDSPPET